MVLELKRGRRWVCAKLCEVDGRGGKSDHGEARKSVCHLIFVATYMAKIGGKLGNIIQMMHFSW